MESVMDTDVAVVGCGPVGAVVANLLGLRGLRVMVLERGRGSRPAAPLFS